MKNNVPLIAAGLSGAGLLAWSLSRRPKMDLRGKVVLITGGSRGLGLQLAREFGAHSARIAICSRNEDELERAKNGLTARGIAAYSVQCDVREPESVAAMVANVTRDFGAIDVLVNNAGIIQAGPIEQQTRADFEQAMDIIFWGALNCVLAVLPSMRSRGEGRIVNITSIGGKVSIPHLVPYSCAKFALVALSEGLSAELAPEGIGVTTVVPGLMRTGSHLKAEFKGSHPLEYAWFSAGAASPLFSISAERAARAIVQATARGDREKILSLPAHVLARFHGAMPEISVPIMALMNRFLPSSPLHQTGTRTGAEARRELNSRLLDLVNTPGQMAAEELNELA